MDDKTDSVVLDRIMIIAIIVSLLFIISLSYGFLYRENNRVCGVRDYNIYEGEDLLYDNYILNSSNSYILVSLDLPKNDGKYLGFCYYINTSSSLMINIIDRDLNILGNDYLFPGNYKKCIDVDYYVPGKSFAFGINCVNCNSSDDLTIGRGLVAKDTSIIIKNEGNYNIFVGDTPGFTFKTYSDCKRSIMWWTGAYVAILAGLFIAYLFIKGKDYMEDFVNFD